MRLGTVVTACWAEQMETSNRTERTTGTLVLMRRMWRSFRAENSGSRCSLAELFGIRFPASLTGVRGKRPGKDLPRQRREFHPAASDLSVMCTALGCDS